MSHGMIYRVGGGRHEEGRGGEGKGKGVLGGKKGVKGDVPHSSLLRRSSRNVGEAGPVAAAGGLPAVTSPGEREGSCWVVAVAGGGLLLAWVPATLGSLASSWGNEVAGGPVSITYFTGRRLSGGTGLLNCRSGKGRGSGEEVGEEVTAPVIPAVAGRDV